MNLQIPKKTYDAIIRGVRQDIQIDVSFSAKESVSEDIENISIGDISNKNENDSIVSSVAVDESGSDKKTLNLTDKEGASIVLTGKDIIAGSFSIDRYCTGSDNIEIGSTISAEMKMTLDNHLGQFDDMDFGGAHMQVYLKIRNEDGTIESIPMGYFIVDSQTRTRTTISIEALDLLAAFDKDFDFSGYDPGMRIKDILDKIVEEGPSIPNHYVYDGAELLNMDYVPPYYPEGENLTCRQILQWICELAGVCAYMDGLGKLKFSMFEPYYIPSTEDIFKLTPKMRYSSEYASTILKLNNIKIKSKDGNVSKDFTLREEVESGADKSVIDEEGTEDDRVEITEEEETKVKTPLCFTIENNEFIAAPEIVKETVDDNQGNGDTDIPSKPDITDPELPFEEESEASSSDESEGDNQESSQKEYDYTYINYIIENLKEMKSISYLPFSATTISLPFLWPLTKIIFVDNEGNGYESIITHHTFNLNGSSSIQAKGASEQKAGYASSNPLTKNQAAIIENTKKELEIKLSEREKEILALNNIPSAMFGLYATPTQKENGSYVYYYHDKETLEESKIVYELSASGFRWTNNYSSELPNWKNGLSDNGSFIANHLSTNGIDASWINVSGDDTNTSIIDDDGSMNASGYSLYDNKDNSNKGSIYMANGNIAFKINGSNPTNINSSGLNTGSATVRESLKIGKFFFNSDDEGNLSIVYEGGND